MIRNWKDKPYSQWIKHLNKLRVKYSYGLPITNDFFLPWHVIDKHEICMSTNEAAPKNYKTDFDIDYKDKDYVY